jgi:transcriptional regulator with XRE-family HTH domain
MKQIDDNRTLKRRIGRAFSQSIRELRHQAGIAQEDLAYAAGIDRGYMSKLERGVHSPGLPLIYRMLLALGVTFTEFAVALDRTERKMRDSGKEPAQKNA